MKLTSEKINQISNAMIEVRKAEMTGDDYGQQEKLDALYEILPGAEEDISDIYYSGGDIAEGIDERYTFIPTMLPADIRDGMRLVRKQFDVITVVTLKFSAQGIALLKERFPHLVVEH